MRASTFVFAIRYIIGNAFFLRRNETSVEEASSMTDGAVITFFVIDFGRLGTTASLLFQPLLDQCIIFGRDVGDQSRCSRTVVLGEDELALLGVQIEILQL